jgi:hypothetical protein
MQGWGERVFGGPVREIKALWAPIGQFFADLWDKITGIFVSAWAKIGPIVDKIKGAASWISDKAGKVGESMATAGTVDEYGRQIPGTSGPRLPLSAQPGAAAAAGAAGQNGTTAVTMDFKNVPQGTTVSTESRGNATPPDVNVGYAFPF